MVHFDSKSDIPYIQHFCFYFSIFLDFMTFKIFLSYIDNVVVDFVVLMSVMKSNYSGVGCWFIYYLDHLAEGHAMGWHIVRPSVQNQLFI